MPRLSVIDGSEDRAPTTPTITVTWWGAVLAVAIFAVWVAGDVVLADWLHLDLDCLEGSHSRRARTVELILCSVGQGPPGWLYLLWLAAPLILLALWLKRRRK